MKICPPNILEGRNEVRKHTNPRQRCCRYGLHPLVSDSQYKYFNDTCNDLMFKLGVTPATEDIWTNPFGSAPLDKKSAGHYKSKLRLFVYFLLEYPGLYDDCLLAFHPRCPAEKCGFVTIDVNATINFMYWAFGAADQPCVRNDGYQYTYPVIHVDASGVKHVRQEPMHSIGAWNDADNLNHLTNVQYTHFEP